MAIAVQQAVRLRQVMAARWDWSGGGCSRDAVARLCFSTRRSLTGQALARERAAKSSSRSGATGPGVRPCWSDPHADIPERLPRGCAESQTFVLDRRKQALLPICNVMKYTLDHNQRPLLCTPAGTCRAVCELKVRSPCHAM